MTTFTATPTKITTKITIRVDNRFGRFLRDPHASRMWRLPPECRVWAMWNGRAYIRRASDGRWIYPAPMPIDGAAYRRRVKGRRR